MRKLTLSAVILGTCLAALALVGADKAALKEVVDEKYKPGQVWSYKTRPGEESSTFTVLRVEEAAKGQDTVRIVHIHVDGIRLKNCTGGPEPDTVAHMPFAKASIDDSAIKNVRTGSVPSFEDGYSEWLKGWDAHKAGFYTISVSQAIEVMQATFSQGLGCPK
jgi:hypothetical protein